MKITQDQQHTLFCPDDKQHHRLINDGEALQCEQCFRIFPIRSVTGGQESPAVPAG